MNVVYFGFTMSISHIRISGYVIRIHWIQLLLLFFFFLSFLELMWVINSSDNKISFSSINSVLKILVQCLSSTNALLRTGLVDCWYSDSLGFGEKLWKVNKGNYEARGYFFFIFRFVATAKTSISNICFSSTEWSASPIKNVSFVSFVHANKIVSVFSN